MTLFSYNQKLKEDPWEGTQQAPWMAPGLGCSMPTLRTTGNNPDMIWSGESQEQITDKVQY